MNIAVLLKQSIQKEAEVQCTSALNKEFLTISDLYALELAGRMKDKYPETKIFGISFCPCASSEGDIRQGLIKALSMTCDKAYMIYDSEFEDSDALAQSHIFSRAISVVEQTEGKVDIVVDGEEEQDGAIGVIGPMTAEVLHIPSVSSVLTAEAVETGQSEFVSGIKIKKRAEDETWQISAKAPVLLTVTKGDKDVRYPTFKRIRWANMQEISYLTEGVLFDDGEKPLIGEYSATKAFKTFSSSRTGEFLKIEEENPEEAATILINRLKERILTESI